MKVVSNRNLRKKVVRRRLQTDLIKSVRSSLVETIYVSTGYDVTPECERYFRIVDLWIRCEGKRSAVLRLKSVYLLALNSMNTTPKVIPFVSTNRRGFPRRFEFLETFYRKQGKSPQAMQAVLSIVGYYRGILAPGTPDLSSITEDSSVDTPESVYDEILELGFDPNWSFKPKQISPIQLELRSKQGPNGQSTINALRDLKVLPESVFNSLIALCKLSDDGDGLAFTLGRLRTKASIVENSLHSKIAIKRELGGKDRAFAMVDYYTQIVLKPLHLKVSNILSSLEEDCTFDQGKGKSQIQSWTSDGQGCSIDLSSASDRFPLSLLERMVAKLTSPEFASNWATVLVDRDFKYKTKFYRWKVGQPLGAKSSWPTFALAHHIVMRAAYKKAGILAREYLILGDDVAMRKSLATTFYLDYLRVLDIKVSETKGLEGNSIEFAKRIFNKGVEVSPIPMPMLFATHKDKFLYAELTAKIKERSSSLGTNLRMSRLELHFKEFFKESTDLFSILSSYPVPQLRSSPCDVDPNEWVSMIVEWNGIEIPRGELSRIFNDVRYRHLVREIDRCQRNHTSWYDSINKAELPGTSTSIRRMHPLYCAFGNLQDEVARARKDVNSFLQSSDPSQLSPSIAVTNVTQLVKGSRKVSRHKGILLLELYQRVKEYSEARISTTDM